MGKKNIEMLRARMQNLGIQGFIVPSQDEFQSEYVPEHLNRLKFFTGFTGSNGVAIITMTNAAFYTDGRYLLQAEKQLGGEYQILDMYKKESCDWFDIGLKKGDVLGYDPRLHTKENLDYYLKLAKRYGFEMKSVANPVDEMWVDRSNGSLLPAYILDQKYTGMSHKDKISLVLSKMEEGAKHLFIANPDAVCWLLNIRASDVLYTPFLLCYALLSKDGSVKLFAEKSKVGFALEGVTVFEISELQNVLKGLDGAVQVDPAKAQISFVNAIGDKCLYAKDPIEKLKAVKNAVEADGFRKCHIVDGAAVTKFLYWLFNDAGDVDEITAEEKLLEFRSLGDGFVYPSFATISAYGGNASVVHYKSSIETNQIIGRDNFYLLDSGGQYYNGTTDVTRTVHLGEPTAEQRRSFTLVLKGHIALAIAKFPMGTTGAHIDSLARVALWREGLDYAHGTGHGVGHFLSVHEGPVRISKASGPAIESGMVLSNEPGLYKNGEFGIRIENLVIARASKYEGFLEFENLTCIPIQKNLIDYAMLSPEEVGYIDGYNAWVVAKLKSYLSEEELDWVSGH